MAAQMVFRNDERVTEALAPYLTAQTGFVNALRKKRSANGATYSSGAGRRRAPMAGHSSKFSCVRRSMNITNIAEANKKWSR